MINKDLTPSRYLLQPKWKSGSIFGGKGWNNWKMGVNNNFYRPTGYSGSMVPSPLSSYPYAQNQLTMSPFAMQHATSSYGGQSVANSNDGWSAPISLGHQQQVAPAIQQSLIGSYESYTQAPLKQQFQIDPYGTKGTSSKYTAPTSTTTKK